MIETGKIWMNGKLVPFKDAKVHVLTHALHYSTSIFEGSDVMILLTVQQFSDYQNMLKDYSNPQNYTQ